MQIIQIGYDIVVECGMKAALITNIFCEQRGSNCIDKILQGQERNPTVASCGKYGGNV